MKIESTKRTLDEKPKRKNDEARNFWQRRGLRGIALDFVLGIMVGLSLIVILSGACGIFAFVLMLN